MDGMTTASRPPGRAVREGRQGLRPDRWVSTGPEGLELQEEGLSSAQRALYLGLPSSCLCCGPSS